MGLNGNRRKPEIGCFTGVGANGKTVLITLMKSIFGDMFSPEPVGLFTGKEISPRNPELLTLRGKRMVVIEEPARESALSSLIKMLEGATIKARDNYARSSDFIEFLPTFGLFMCFNDAPKFPGDGGVRRRIRAIRFPMRFCDSPKEDFERKADPMIKENFRNNPIWRNAGFEILRRKYVAFRESGYTLTTPPGILETSSEVIDSGNDIVDWFNRYYEKTNVDSDRVIKGNLYEHYRSTTMSGAFSQQKFSKLIGDYQIPTKCSNGIRYFVGVKLRETKPETSECDITE